MLYSTKGLVLTQKWDPPQWDKAREALKQTAAAWETAGMLGFPGTKKKNLLYSKVTRSGLQVSGIVLLYYQSTNTDA